MSSKLVAQIGCVSAASIAFTTLMIRRASTSAPWIARARYPSARRTKDVDTFHNTKVPNPYSYLEDPDSKETAEFVTAQNINSKEYFEHAKCIPKLRSRMAELYDYPKFGTPFKRGSHIYFFENNGLENQYRLMQANPDGTQATCLLDPNKLRDDGTAALRSFQISEDGAYLAYGVSYGGSDWFTIFVRDVKTGQDLLQDQIEWCKFSEIEFDKGGHGFYYCSYPPPKGMASGGGSTGAAQTSAGTETDAAKNQKVMYHKIGTKSEEDILIYHTPDQPDWMFGASVTHDGAYLMITTNDSCDPVNRLYLHSLQDNSLENNQDGTKQVVKAVDNLKAKWQYLHNIGKEFWFVTNLNAPKNKIVKVTLPANLHDAAQLEQVINAFDEQNFIDIVLENENVLETAQVVANDVIVLRHLVDCKHELSMVNLSNGQIIQNIEFPTIGTVLGITGRPIDSGIYFKVYNFLSPGTIYQCDVEKKQQAMVKE
jgi:prolyl oligopeptidase